MRGPSEQTRNNEGPDYIQVDKTPVVVHTQTTKQPSPMNERDSPVAPQSTIPPDDRENKIGQNLAPAPTPAPVHIPCTTATDEPFVEMRRSMRIRRENSKYYRELYDLPE